MEIIVIGKPAINVYLPLVEFPQEGDLFNITAKNESVGNIGATSACLLAKWGMSTHFSGVVGNDSYADKIRQTFMEHKVNTKFMEVNFETGTSTNYIILNTKSGVVSKILYNDTEATLNKFKYDFIPDFAVIDGTDLPGAWGLLNTNGSCKTVFYGRVGDKDTVNVSKKCTWVVCTQQFVEMMTKTKLEDSQEAYIDIYQKIVDISGKSNYIVLLKNRKILYSIDGQVKLVPEMKINVADLSSFDSIFVGALSFCLANDVKIDDAIKFADTAAAISISRIGEVGAIPTVDEVLDNSGLREKLGLANKGDIHKHEDNAPKPIGEAAELAASEPEQPVAMPEANATQDAAFGTQPTESVEMPQLTQTEAQPVEMPQPQQPVQQEEPNMFDNPNV